MCGSAKPAGGCRTQGRQYASFDLYSPAADDACSGGTARRGVGWLVTAWLELPLVWPPLPLVHGPLLVSGRLMVSGIRAVVTDSTNAIGVAARNTARRMRLPPQRLTSQPQTERPIVASSTKTKTRLPASSGVMPYRSTNVFGKYSENATKPPNDTSVACITSTCGNIRRMLGHHPVPVKQVFSYRTLSTKC